MRETKKLLAGGKQITGCEGKLQADGKQIIILSSSSSNNNNSSSNSSSSSNSGTYTSSSVRTEPVLAS